MTSRVARALELANSQIGVREAGRNRGPHVDLYIRAAGLDPNAGSYPWCAAFVQWCFRIAEKELGLPHALPRTAGVMKLLERSRDYVVGLPTAGCVFITESGKGKGHTGFVELLSPDGLITIEGNTDLAGDREGDGVYRRVRSAKECVAFLDFSLAGDE